MQSKGESSSSLLQLPTVLAQHMGLVRIIAQYAVTPYAFEDMCALGKLAEAKWLVDVLTIRQTTTQPCGDRDEEGTDQMVDPTQQPIEMAKERTRRACGNCKSYGFPCLNCVQEETCVFDDKIDPVEGALRDAIQYGRLPVLQWLVQQFPGTVHMLRDNENELLTMAYQHAQSHVADWLVATAHISRGEQLAVVRHVVEYFVHGPGSQTAYSPGLLNRWLTPVILSLEMDQD